MELQVLNSIVSLILVNHIYIFLGFGRSVSWKEDTVVPPGHTMSYKDALHIVSKDFIPKLLFPGWAMGLTPSLRKVKFGFEELRVRPYNLNILPSFFGLR